MLDWVVYHRVGLCAPEWSTPENGGIISYTVLPRAGHLFRRSVEAFFFNKCSIFMFP